MIVSAVDGRVTSPSLADVNLDDGSGGGVGRERRLYGVPPAPPVPAKAMVAPDAAILATPNGAAASSAFLADGEHAPVLSPFPCVEA